MATLVRLIREWAAELGFSLVKGGSGSKPGKVEMLRCGRGTKYMGRSKSPQRRTRTKKGGCLFELKLRSAASVGASGEHTVIWAVQGGFFVHNHALQPDDVREEGSWATALETNADLILRLREEHIPCGSIAAAINVVSGVDSVRAKDIANTTRPRGSSWNVSMEEIRSLFADGSSGVRGRIDTFPNSELRDILWTIPPAIGVFSHFPFVVSVDTTYHTNSVGMPLLLFTAVDMFGASFCIGGALLHDEQTEQFVSAFEHLRLGMGEHVAQRVSCFVSDEDGAEMSALRQVFPLSLNRLCEFHLWNNFHSGKYNALGKDVKGVANASFSALLRAHSVVDFEERYSHAVQDERLSPLMGQFRKLARHREHFCRAWVSTYTTLGVKTSGRSESENARVKEKLRGFSQLSEIISYTSRKFKRYSSSRLRNERLHFDMSPVEMDPMLGSILAVVPRYFSSHVVKYWERSEDSELTCETAGEGKWRIRTGSNVCEVEGGFEVSKPLQCSCLTFRKYLLPCAHAFKVLRLLHRELSSKDVFPFWRWRLLSGSASECSIPTISSLARVGPESAERAVQSVLPRPNDRLRTAVTRLWGTLKSVRSLVENDLGATIAMTSTIEAILSDTSVPIATASLNATPATAEIIQPPRVYPIRARGTHTARGDTEREAASEGSMMNQQLDEDSAPVLLRSDGPHEERHTHEGGGLLAVSDSCWSATASSDTRAIHGGDEGTPAERICPPHSRPEEAGCRERSNGGERGELETRLDSEDESHETVAEAGRHESQQTTRQEERAPADECGDEERTQPPRRIRRRTATRAAATGQRLARTGEDSSASILSRAQQRKESE
jgi:hypothetical protein